MAEYTLTECNPLGEKDPKYGQTYWGKVQENQVPVMFNSATSVTAGNKISFEAMEPKQSKKGTDYMRLKKVRVIGHIENPGPSSDDSELLKLIREIHKVVVGDAFKKDEETVPEDVPVDLSDIPF